MEIAFRKGSFMGGFLGFRWVRNLFATPVPCCEDCLSTHRAEWEIRPNPYRLYGMGGPPCVYCSAAEPAWILAVACPIGQSRLQTGHFESDAPDLGFAERGDAALGPA